MAGFVLVRRSPDPRSPYREEREGRAFKEYRPDLLLECDNRVSPDVAELVGEVYARLAAFGAKAAGRDLGLLFATLLKSESISSSMIEGYRAPPKDVLMAEFQPEIAGHTANTVFANLTMMRRALPGLDGDWTDQAIDDLHFSLLPGAGHGYRRSHVWVGGRSPARAQYVAPAANLVPALMSDLIGYANTGGETAIVKAAIIHAQFETIHPFDDGNGRTGRALVHSVLRKTGLLGDLVLPVSTVLKARAGAYVDALGAYRYQGEGSAARRPGLDRFVEEFAVAVGDAVVLAEQTMADVDAVERSWRERTARIRGDSVAHKVVQVLTARPIVTVPLLASLTGANDAPLRLAVSRLEDAGILERAQGKYRRTAVWWAPEVLGLLQHAERRNASPAMDTTVAAPALPVPRPVDKLTVVCGHQMERTGATCTLNKGHKGRHRGTPRPDQTHG